MTNPIKDEWISPDGSVRLILGDALEVLPTIEPGSVSLLFTSPPYNLGTSTGGGFPIGHYDPDTPLGKRGSCGKWNGGSLRDGYGAFDDALPHEEYVQQQKQVLAACWNVLCDDGAIFYNHKPRVLGNEVVTPLTYNPGLPVRQIIIWARAGGINFSPSFYLPTHEWIVIFAKPAWRLRDKSASGAGDVWYVPQGIGTDHPAPFPIKLPLTAIETTKPGLVCDPYFGSGTTAIAAIRKRRPFVGCELNPEFFAGAVVRVQQEMDRFPLFGRDDRSRQLSLLDS